MLLIMIIVYKYILITVISKQNNAYLKISRFWKVETIKCAVVCEH